MSWGGCGPHAATPAWWADLKRGGCLRCARRAVQDCSYFAGANCTQQERYPGLWEFPLLNTQSESECPVALSVGGEGLGPEGGRSTQASRPCLFPLSARPPPQRCQFVAAVRVGRHVRPSRAYYSNPAAPMSPADGTLLYSMDPGTTGGDGAYTSSASNTSGMPPDELEALLKQNFDYRCCPARGGPAQSRGTTAAGRALFRAHCARAGWLPKRVRPAACRPSAHRSTPSGPPAPAAPPHRPPPRSYNGNRAPYGLYIHTPWLTPDNIQAANNFLDYALGLNNTWVVTVRQVIEWMQARGACLPDARLLSRGGQPCARPRADPAWQPARWGSTRPALPDPGSCLSAPCMFPRAAPNSAALPPCSRCRTRSPPARWTTG